MSAYDPHTYVMDDSEAIDLYFEHMGSTCDHRHDEHPPDCPRLAQRAEDYVRALQVYRLATADELTALRAALAEAQERVARMEGALRVIASMEPAPGSVDARLAQTEDPIGGATIQARAFALMQTAGIARAALDAALAPRKEPR